MEREFKLKKVAWVNGELDCKYVMTETNDDGIVTIKANHVKDSRPIHKDLQNLFLLLVPIAAEIFRWEHVVNVSVTGFSLAGKDDNIGVTIFGNYLTTHGTAKFKSPRIKYLAGDSKVCSDLTMIIDLFVTEIDSYLFNDKVAEMGTFGE